MQDIDSDENWVRNYCHCIMLCVRFMVEYVKMNPGAPFFYIVIHFF